MPPPHHPTRLVIFDVDGTLTATTGVDDECLVLAWTEVFGIDAGEIDTDWTHYEHSTDEGLTLEVCRRALKRDPTRPEVARVQAAFFRLLRESIAADERRCVAVPGARELLAELPRRGYAVGIASGAWEQSARIKLAAAGIDASRLPGTFSHGHSPPEAKPAVREEIVAATIAHLSARARAEGASSTRAIYFGDGLWDVRAARALNIGFIGVRVNGDNTRFEQAGVRRIVRNYSDLQSTLRFIEEAFSVSEQS